MAGEDLLEGDDGGTNDTSSSSSSVPGGKKGKKPLSKGQKIGLLIGLVTIALVVVQIERSKAAASSSGTTATTSSTPIDPQTGYPEGSAQDEAALSQLGNASGGGSSDGYGSSTSSGDSSTDPATGVSYSSEISQLGAQLGTLGTDFTTDQGNYTTLTSELAAITPGSPTYVAPTTTTTTNKTANPALTTTLTNLSKDEAIAAKPGATAAQKKAVINLTTRAKKLS